MPEEVYNWPTEFFQGTPKFYNEAKQREIDALRDLMMQKHAPISTADRAKLTEEKSAILAKLRPQSGVSGARLSNKERLDLKKQLDEINRKIDMSSGFKGKPEELDAKKARIAEIEKNLSGTATMESGLFGRLGIPAEILRGIYKPELDNLQKEIGEYGQENEFYTHKTPPTIMEQPKLDEAGNVVTDADGIPIMERISRVVTDTKDKKLESARNALRTAASDAQAPNFTAAKDKISSDQTMINAANTLIGQGASAPDQSNIDAYMNPYTDRAMQSLEDQTVRTLQEKLLPAVYGRHMGMNFNTGARQADERNLLRDVAESLHKKRAELQLHGQDQALKLASAGKERELTAGRAKGEIANSQADRNIREAETLGNLEALTSADKLARADVLHQTAEREQRQLQRERDMQVHQFEKEAEAPFIQAARYSSLLNGQAAGLPTHTFQASSPGSAPDTNLGTVVGGALTQLAGLAGMNRQKGQGMFSKGGRVHRAGGGMMNQYGRGDWMKPPTEEEMAPYMASPELEQAKAYHNNDNIPNPYWAGLAKMGSNMMTHATKSPLDAFAASGPQFHEGFTGAMNEQKLHAEKAAQFNMLLHKSRLEQKNAMMQRKYDNENMAMTEALKTKELEQTGKLQESQIDLNKAHALMYQAKANGGGKRNPAHDDDADKQILKNAVTGATSAPDMISNLDQLDALADKVGGGTATAQHEWTSSPYKQSRIHGVEQSDIELFDKITNQIVIDATAKFGQRGGARIAALITESKPNRKMTPEGIRQAIQNIRRAVDHEAKRSEYILEQTEKGVSPKKALLDFDKLYAKEMQNKSLAPQGEKKAESTSLAPQGSPASNSPKANKNTNVLSNALRAMEE